MLEYSDPDESDDDGPMDPVDLPIPTENLAAVRQADQDLHPALLLRQQEEAEAEAERARELGAIEAEALDDARLSAVVYKDGKGGNTGAIEIQLDLDRDKIAKANEKARKRSVLLSLWIRFASCPCAYPSLFDLPSCLEPTIIPLKNEPSG